MFVWQLGNITSTSVMSASTAGTLVVPTAATTTLSANYIAIPESTTAANFTAAVSASYYSSGFDGSTYKPGVPARAACETGCYDKMILITDSVGVDNGSVVNVSSMTVSGSSLNYLKYLKLNIKEKL